MNVAEFTTNFLNLFSGESSENNKNKSTLNELKHRT